MSLKIHHLNCASLCPITGDMVCHCLLVEYTDGLILIDTGLGTKDITEKSKRLDLGFRLLVRPKLDIEETALYQIQKVGYKREDVKHIVLTHLHVDHAGGITDFPSAMIHALRLEYRNIYNKNKILPGYSKEQFNKEINWKIHDVMGEKWNGFNKVNILEGIDDILLIPLRGHTNGHCGIAINSTDGWVLHCGDAYFHSATIKKGLKETPFSINLFQKLVEYNSETRLRNQHRLRKLFLDKKSEIKLICSHDTSEYNACNCGKNPKFIYG
jgi:glyoxylase-like metal-dependent hydrolase (beta-lactamase superfamily II)